MWHFYCNNCIDKPHNSDYVKLDAAVQHLNLHNTQEPPTSPQQVLLDVMSFLDLRRLCPPPSTGLYMVKSRNIIYPFVLPGAIIFTDIRMIRRRTKAPLIWSGMTHRTTRTFFPQYGILTRNVISATFNGFGSPASNFKRDMAPRHMTHRLTREIELMNNAVSFRNSTAQWLYELHFDTNNLRQEWTFNQRSHVVVDCSTQVTIASDAAHEWVRAVTAKLFGLDNFAVPALTLILSTIHTFKNVWVVESI